MTPNVWHAKPGESDQLFSLLHGVKEHAGAYAIKGKDSGKVLFSRTKQEPKVGHIGGDGDFYDNWFLFSQGVNGDSDAFRIMAPSTATVLYSGTSVTPPFGNMPQDIHFAATYFKFEFEAVKIKAVTFDLDHGISAVVPFTLAPESFTNEGKETVEHTFHIVREFTTTSVFIYRGGFPIPTGTPFSAHLPTLNGRNGEIDQNETAVHFGVQESFPKTFTADVKATVKPGQTATVTPTGAAGTLVVPFTIDSTMENSGIGVQTTGQWSGRVISDLTYPVQLS
ncbi:hemolytic lectin [Trametes polyzona]|nr:hemolytic lectin [Trametes polyzona]